MAPWAVRVIHILSKGIILEAISELKIDENPVQKLDAKKVGSGAASERILARYWTLGPSSSIGFNEGNQRFHFFDFFALNSLLDAKLSQNEVQNGAKAMQKSLIFQIGYE